MKISDFDYELPEGRIASQPLKDRPAARLVFVPRQGGELRHGSFREIPSIFRAGDVLVLNDTQVIPARLLGKRETGGKLEIFLLARLEKQEWEALIRPSERVHKGQEFEFGRFGDKLRVRVLDEHVPGSVKRRVILADNEYLPALRKVGHVPLPPYIRRSDTPEDREFYQTVFARAPGAVAAPTAGLHFDKFLLKQIEDIGVKIVYVTLHVSYGTFQPVKVENVEDHQMFEEFCEISEDAAEAIMRARAERGRVFACGTTVVRTLESAAAEDGSVRPFKGTTRIFIYPGYRFRAVDALITNFHLPRSTLLLLTAGFLGSRERLLEVYREAIRLQYRFYSYGDAMVIYS
ncbi:MAG: tRNA preQ1(34) S-adenosylmethionine ribosyltransferase-isomerase QueA [Candidatus Omnitrophota bacterium]